MKNMSLKRIKPYFLSLALAFVPLVSSAEQSAGQRCEVFKRSFKGIFDWVPERYCSIEALLMWVIQTGLMLVGGVTVLFLILGGFWYLTSAGNEEQAEKGRKTVTNSIVGLVVVIMSFVIVKVVTNLLTAK
jgi:hypothetical protein